MKFLFTHKLLIFGAFFGAALGYAYYFFVGCKSGTCLITGRPVNSSVYGAVMGILATNLFVNGNKKSDDNAD